MVNVWELFLKLYQLLRCLAIRIWGDFWDFLNFDCLLEWLNLLLPFLSNQRYSLSYLAVFKVWCNKVSPKSFVFLCCKLYDFLSFFISIKGRLKSIHWCFGKHFIQHYTGWVFFILWDWKCRLHKRYLFHLFAAIIWKKFRVLAL